MIIVCPKCFSNETSELIIFIDPLIKIICSECLDRVNYLVLVTFVVNIC